MVISADATVHCLQGALPCSVVSISVGSPVVSKMGGISLWQHSSGWGVAIRYTKDSNMMVLLCHLSMLVAWHSFAFTACHVAGLSNSVADALSWFDFQRFCQLGPQARSYRHPSASFAFAQLSVVWLRSAILSCEGLDLFYSLSVSSSSSSIHPFFVLGTKVGANGSLLPTNVLAFLFPPGGSVAPFIHKGLLVSSMLIARWS